MAGGGGLAWRSGSSWGGGGAGFGFGVAFGFGSGGGGVAGVSGGLGCVPSAISFAVWNRHIPIVDVRWQMASPGHPAADLQESRQRLRLLTEMHLGTAAAPAGARGQA